MKNLQGVVFVVLLLLFSLWGCSVSRPVDDPTPFIPGDVAPTPPGCQQGVDC
jgi:hypothetical protein